MNRRTFLASTPTLALLVQSLPVLSAETGNNSSQFEAVIKSLEADYGPNLSVSPTEGKFLNMLTRLSGCKQALEIGTSRGYGTLWLAAALKKTGGKLISIDILKERTEEARENLQKAGLTSSVEFKTDDAHKIIPDFKNKFNVVFLDADKKGNLDYFEKLHPKLLADNAVILAHGAKTMQKDMKNFLDAVGASADFESVTLQVVAEEAMFMAMKK